MPELTEREALIVKLWNDEGLSGTEIASRLGMQRSAISGAIHRLRERNVFLKARKGGTVKPAPPKQEAVVRIKPPVELEAPENSLDARQASRIAEGSRPVPFHLSEGCMWPLWAGARKSGLVCGLDLPETSGPKYCEFHRRRALTSAAKE